MKSLFEPAAVNELTDRMAHLRPDSERQWGKMDVAQMLAHCSAAIGMAEGKVTPPRIWLGRLLGPLAKKTNGTSWWSGSSCVNQLTALRRVGPGYVRSIRTSFSAH